MQEVVEIKTEKLHRQQFTHVKHESQQTQTVIAFNSIPFKYPDYFRASGAVGVLSGGMSSRLFTGGA